MTAEKSGVFGPDTRVVVNRVLIVDDDVQNCELTAEWLIADGFDAEWHASGEGALRVMADNDFGVVVTDFHLSGMSGGDLCRRISAMRWDIPVIVMSSFRGPIAMREAMGAGAYDFLPKPFSLESLSVALRRAFERRNLQLEVKRLRRMARDEGGYGDLQGVSAAMRRVYDSLDAIARLDAPVLITGEVGTGRETLARELHLRSRRGVGPFVAFNCAAMSEVVLRCNLFGHVQGAFAGLGRAHAGLFVAAERGTILLCEIGGLPPGVQAELLRALAEKRVRPVGSSVERPVDVRIMVTSCHDLAPLMRDGSFSADLFHRLGANHVTVPPLRERAGDVLLLADYFLRSSAERARKEVTGISAPAAARLAEYHWPGNVRELKSCMERGVFLSRSKMIHLSNLPERVRTHRGSHVLAASGDRPHERVSND